MRTRYGLLGKGNASAALVALVESKPTHEQLRWEAGHRKLIAKKEAIRVKMDFKAMVARLFPDRTYFSLDEQFGLPRGTVGMLMGHERGAIVRAKRILGLMGIAPYDQEYVASEEVKQAHA